MKLIWTILLVVAVSTVSRAGDNVFSTIGVTSAPGQEAVINISLDNSDEVNGLQFDIVLPEGIALVKDNNDRPIFTTTERTPEFSRMCKEIEKGRSRLMLFSYRAELVRGTDGVVLSMPVTCDGSIQPGNYTVRFIGVCLSLSGKSKEKVACEPGDFEAVVTVK